MTSFQYGASTKDNIKEYFKKHLQENDYPDGPFELFNLADVQHQIDVWK